jgi:hypothetical protein
MANGFSLNASACEQPAVDEQTMRHLRNSLPANDPISLFKIPALQVLSGHYPLVGQEHDFEINGMTTAPEGEGQNVDPSDNVHFLRNASRSGKRRGR